MTSFPEPDRYHLKKPEVTSRDVMTSDFFENFRKCSFYYYIDSVKVSRYYDCLNGNYGRFPFLRNTEKTIGNPPPVILSTLLISELQVVWS